MLMALYTYEALAKDGKKIKGTVDAPSATIVRELLTKQGLYPIYVTLSGGGIGFFARMFRGVSTKEKITLTKQLTVLLRSGVPLLQSLELLIDQFKGTTRSMLVTIKDEVKGGRTLADSLNRYSYVFDPIYIQLVRAGEASGKLEVVLDRLATNLERQAEIARKVRSALQTPIIQAIAAVVVIIVLLTTVVPQIVGVLATQGIKLPWTTRLLLTLSNFFMSMYALITAAIIALLVAAFIYWKRTPSGGRLFDAFILKIPLVGHLARTSAVVQFSYTLGLLLEGGVNLAQALDIVTNIVNNQVLAHKLKQARENIIKQGKVAEYLKQTNIFPSIAIYLIQTGEQSGQLDAMLLLVARNYEEELNDLIDRLTGLIGPATLVIMAGAVGFIIMSVMGPILTGGQQMASGA